VKVPSTAQFFWVPQNIIQLNLLLNSEQACRLSPVHQKIGSLKLLLSSIKALLPLKAVMVEAPADMALTYIEATFVAVPGMKVLKRHY
jgi:hypothetical protein